MSEQELNSILEEIKNRGKNSEGQKADTSSINFEFNSAPRRSRRERLAEEESDEVAPSQAPATTQEEGKLVDEAVENEEVVLAEDIEDEVEIEPVVEAEELVEEPVEDEIVIEAEEVEEAPDEVVDEAEITAVFVEPEPVDAEQVVDDAPEYEEEIPAEKKSKLSNKKGILIGAVVVVLVAIAVFVSLIIAGKMNRVEAPVTKAPAIEGVVEAPTEAVDNTPKNPLTGESGYNEAAIGKRPVAVVVENEYSTESVRPQWGLANADIVMEAESEYSTRLLLFWADYTTVPEKVGPARSARPPFIRFSELFDAVFIHAGLSHSKGDYVGADSVFESDNVDHINLLHTSGDGTYFGRDYSRSSAVEHTGFLNGTNTAKMLEAYKINTDFEPAKYTQLSFNDEAVDMSQTSAKSVDFRWSSKTGRCPKTGKFTYNEESKKYTTTDFDSKYGQSNAEWENLVLLLDNTTYIEKHNYKGSHTEIYCDYSLSGGNGLIASNGTAVEITWGVSNGKLWFKDANGNEVKLNKGKTYIGYGSQNHGGYFTINE